jgi:hypothetical protein
MTRIGAVKISAVFLVFEMWAVDRRSGGGKIEGPAEELPDRRECLSVLEMHTDGKALKHTMYLANIIR